MNMYSIRFNSGFSTQEKTKHRATHITTISLLENKITPCICHTDVVCRNIHQKIVSCVIFGKHENNITQHRKTKDYRSRLDKSITSIKPSRFSQPKNNNREKPKYYQINKNK